MSLYTARKIDFQHIDERGSLSQLIHDGFKQINVLESKKGVERGSHFHKESIEAFYVISGSVKVILWSKNEKEEVVFNKGDFFEIHPFVLHNMLFLSDCLMVQMYDRPVEKEDGTKDIYTEVEF
ncbi:MAG: WxcM-like domain-containing protein [Bacilli bacterium]|nr:WxcM-like domain-containing protein [Bacilli bacterium]